MRKFFPTAPLLLSPEYSEMALDGTSEGDQACSFCASWPFSCNCLLVSQVVEAVRGCSYVLSFMQDQIWL